jgi:mannitol/fructose-specific phosphotransferase system IIA component (Ntr-type)
MARDRLVPPAFAVLGRFRTPTLAVSVTAALMALAILTLDIAAIAKLASAFQLLLFSLLNLAVVIMRESEIEGYDPGFRSPLYPGMQVLGFLAPLWLIAEMGQVAILFTFGLVGLTIGWYFYYARPRVTRSGAIFHTFARLGELRHSDLDLELRDIAKERGLRDSDPYDEVVARAPVIDVREPISRDLLARRLLSEVARTTAPRPDDLASGIAEAFDSGFVPMDRRMALMHWRAEGLSRTTMILVRCGAGITGSLASMDESALGALRGVIVLISRQEEPGRHLRLLGHLAGRMEQPTFADDWREASSEAELRTTLLREERTLTLRVGAEPTTASWAGRPLHAIGLPPDTLVALVLRRDEEIVPSGATTLRDGDHVTVIGSAQGIERLRARVTGGLEAQALAAAGKP